MHHDKAGQVVVAAVVTPAVVVAGVTVHLAQSKDSQRLVSQSAA